MNQSRLARLLIQPTTSGLLTAFGLSLAIMVISGFAYTTRNGLFYDYLFGSGSSVTLIETSRSTIAVFNETVFGNTILNKVLFFVFWMVIGLIVYVILSGIGSGVSTAERSIEEARFVHAQKLKMGSELGLKVVLHLIGAGLLIMYGFLFFKVLLPFSVLCARIVAGDLKQPINWFYALLGLLVLTATFYLGTILVRFLFLRPRIFGGWEDIVEDEVEHGVN
jgi:hypothetical protein